MIGLIQVGISLSLNKNRLDPASNVGLWMTMAIAFSCSIGFMWLFHTFLLCKNWSSLEMAELGKQDIFSHQKISESWKQAFGDNRLYWFIPVRAPQAAQGLDYEANIPIGSIVEQTESNQDEKL